MKKKNNIIEWYLNSLEKNLRERGNVYINLFNSGLVLDLKTILEKRKKIIKKIVDIAKIQ